MQTLCTYAIGPILGCGLLFSAPAQAQTYAVDKGHSNVLFKVSYLGGHFYGSFRDFSGSIVIDESALEKSSVNFEVKTASIETFVEKRNQDLRGPGFFSAKQFPTATFRSTKVEKAGDRYRVSGDFTLRGVTKPVAFEVVPLGTAKDMMGNAHRGFETTLTIKRQEYGVSYMADAIGDDVTLIIALNGVQK